MFPYPAVTFGPLEEYRFIGFSRETTEWFLRIHRLRLHSGHPHPRLFTVMFAGFHVFLLEDVFEVACPALLRHTWKPGLSMSP